MSIGGKIRFLLFLLGVCCILTALSLKNSITASDLLAHEATELQENLNVKERFVQSILADHKELDIIKQFQNNGPLAINFIERYRSYGINVLVYKRNELVFWSTYKVMPKSIAQLREGTSFQQYPNGYYEVMKKTTGDFAYAFFINVKSNYAIQNQYLEQKISPELFDGNSLKLAGFNDKESKEIFSKDKKYLFSVKLSDDFTDNVYTSLQLWLWIAGILCICLFINSFCSQLAKRGYLVLATLTIGAFFLVLRLTDLKYFWFNHQLNLEIFDPKIYAQSDFLPSLGDLLLNIIALSWVMLFAYVHRNSYKLPNFMAKGNVVALICLVAGLCLVGYVGFFTEELFTGLVLNSKINFDITNIINLDWMSWLCILILCLVWFNIYLFIEVMLSLSGQLSLDGRRQAIIFIGLLAMYSLYCITTKYQVYHLIFAGLVFVLAYNNYTQNSRFSIGIYALIFLCMASISALKYIKFIDVRERNLRAVIAKNLTNTDDPKVDNILISLEGLIANDSLVINYFKNPLRTQTYNFHDYLIKNYLEGYLSNFNAKIYEYNIAEQSLKNNESLGIERYKSLVTDRAVKTENSSFFYRVNDTFGFQNYFGIIPIFNKHERLGSLVIDLQSRPYDYNSHFPDLLIDGKLKSDEKFDGYSFAFYRDGLLNSRSGRFTYPTIDNGFYSGAQDSVIFKQNKQYVEDGFNATRYSHAIYQPEAGKTLVITSEKISYVTRLATLSFFFIVFILFAIVLYILIWFAENANVDRGGWFSINRYLMINANRILYKTRIQLSIVLAVVATLLIIGWTTFYNLSREYSRQQEETVREKLRKVQLSYERKVQNLGFIGNDEDARNDFNTFADLNGATLNLFDMQGNLYLTSLSKLYDSGIVSRKMGPLAFIHLNQMGQSEYINPKEKIGNFTYAAAYAPIRDAQHQTIAYIGMPYYGNEAEYQSKMGLFLNTLINIYALVFVLVGVLAVFLANQITSPLNFIQQIISRTKLGEKNEPLIWHRQDEIGTLVKEYNKMIAALEQSATKLARSERESAWREMAKQVAHEIKNPLTPLKLGVQLLERSWREKDPNFQIKFEKFSKSFLEQIDSLSTIAMEFSNFAKMPETKLEQLELIPIINQATEVFKSWENVEILTLNRSNKALIVNADKDQLLRTFNNLLKNAIEAVGEIRKCAIKIHIANDEKMAYVDVEDNGNGIEKLLQDKIFTPNFTTKSSGTGLGLAFVKQATENAGGTIHFHSEENKGTTFYLSFPLT